MTEGQVHLANLVGLTWASAGVGLGLIDGARLHETVIRLPEDVKLSAAGLTFLGAALAVVVGVADAWGDWAALAIGVVTVVLGPVVAMLGVKAYRKLAGRSDRGETEPRP